MPPSPAIPAVLIVEDDEMVQATLRMTLEREKFRVVTSSDPREALGLVAAQDFAVIISDYRMPEMTGLEFLVECRRMRPHSSRILLTAVLNLATVIEAINRGEICRFIAKPWLRTELLAAVCDAIQRHDLTLHNQALQAETTRLNQELISANRAMEQKLHQLQGRALKV